MSLLALLAALVGGVALSLFLDGDEDAPLHVRLAQGAVFGPVLLAACGYPLGAWFGMRLRNVGLAALLALLPAVLLPTARWRALRPGLTSWSGLLYAAAAGGLLLAFFDRVFLQTASGLSTGVDHNIADLPFHISIVQSFVLGDNFPPRHPELAAARLSYPFLADFGVAQLVTLGLTLRQAVTVQNAALILALFALLHRFALVTTGDRLAARLAPPLVFLSGGFGFALLFGRVGTPLSLDLLRRLPINVTMLPDGPVRFGNALTTLLATQRSLLMGAPLALIAFTLMWRAYQKEGAAPRRPLLAAALVTGLMPLVHMHSAAVVLAVGGALALLHRNPTIWIWPAVLALVLVVPQALWLLTSSSMAAQGFLAWHPGWEAGHRNLLVFWLWNAGLFLPVLFFASVRLASPQLRRFQLPFWALFIVPNLLRLSPWSWDNMKFFFFWLLGSAPLVALAVARLARASSPLRFTAAPLFVALVLSGGLDVGRVITRQIELGVFDRDRIALAEAIARSTPRRSVLLRAPTHDSAALLAGRLSVLGYPGHIWSQGFEEGDLQPAISRVYAGAPDARALLDRLGVDFILVGPDERRAFRVNDSFLSSFAPVLETRGAVLRRVR